ncbi:TPA: hypothetical protein N0F65_007899 [Lagenidium giganteum]|uniref:BART domain-containing protein n=1 Tax=Lagenidium giganteum TaxID=4803 RepID=A0AAV2Z3D3_9STRA|nr:TPA: hypothetical protein N0F65_007899 [Lagenidium giganteum]
MDEVLVAVESSDALIARLVAHCDQNDVEQRFVCFQREHAADFLGIAHDDEKTHRIHDLFREYEALFEDVLGDFLDKERLSPDEFYDHCRLLQRSCRHEDAISNLDCVLSALDFDVFCDLMERSAIAMQQALKAAEDMGL